ncbi:MAG: Asp-tRNA(Asn)/Glu-tRNA(Gln) amidotransferase subunit GatB [Candidatus Berkelbacteria bacterium]|nr:Asp-tRNA(Asn)/Glu-tRNA(Gln) amidotransferase subunit GatB [Candidatus Berkelbacteria bacterium]
MSDFKTTIGLEIHCQLKTKSKMFCSCDNNAENAEPNSLVCPVCLAMPGTLPVANRSAIEMTIMTGLALGCDIPSESKFDRKHYFYPDLPKGYQISQYDKPFCKGGEVEVSYIRTANETNSEQRIETRKIRLNRIHLEEDAGKLTHPAGKDYSLVDLNRAGTPLMEIVTEPDITSPAEARQFMEELQLALKYLKVSDADMEKGHVRCDANISIQKDGKSSPIIEIKNLNSFKFVEQALAFEEKRLTADFENWPEKMGKITRGFDSNKGITFEQRRKEEAADYRYFPEPDIPPISFSETEINDLRLKIKELPKQKQKKFIEAGIRVDVAEKLVRQPHLAEYLETSTQLKHDLAVFISEEVTRAIAEHQILFEEYQTKVPVTKIADLLNLVAEGIISKTVAKEIFYEMIVTGEVPADIIKKKGLEQVSDTGELESVINQIVKENPDLVEKYRSGKIQVVGFFVGKIMQSTSGKANPQVLNKLLKEKLDGHSA